MSKVLVRDDDGMAAYVWPSSYNVELLADKVVVKEDNQVLYNISDLNATNSTFHSNVSDIPEDWAGGKYMFDGSSWTVNPVWETEVNTPDGDNDPE
tara:strand:+ start:175 stop:462 length:288 start_codon:yes stop_codon:yes gene_type:complete